MPNEEALIIRVPSAVAEKQLVEVCRSFSYKLNLANHGGPAYESADFFASRKMTCAVEDQDWVSQQIFEECVAEVREAAAAFIRTMKGQGPRRAGNGSNNR